LYLLHEFGAKSSLKPRRNQCRFVHANSAAVNILGARNFRVTHEALSGIMNKTQTQELKRRERERDIFCVISDAFRVFAHRSAIMLGSAWAFAAAVIAILVWIVTGPTFHFSDTWQLIINTATTIITFLMVFLIQNTQNRDAKAMHLKLDELIRAVKGARNRLVDLENLSDEELKRLEEQFRRLRKLSENSQARSNNGQPAKSR